MQINLKQVGILIGGILIGALLILLILGLRNSTRPAGIFITPQAPTIPAPPTPSPGPINVHVSGHVNRPDVYQLSADGIVKDAIEAAGGFSVDANPDIVNLALPLNDGMQIYVPSHDETFSPPTLPGGGSRSGIIGALININTASQQELELLPGIGPSTAEKIITHRQENGPFQTIEAIMNVSGIGPATYDDIKELITIN